MFLWVAIRTCSVLDSDERHCLGSPNFLSKHGASNDGIQDGVLGP